MCLSHLKGTNVTFTCKNIDHPIKYGQNRKEEILK